MLLYFGKSNFKGRLFPEAALLCVGCHLAVAFLLWRQYMNR